MDGFEFASYWIWDTRSVGAAAFADLRRMTAEGWQVVGTMLPMPEAGEHAGVWVMRRRRAAVPASLAA